MSDKPIRYIGHAELRQRGVALSVRQLARLEAIGQFPKRAPLSRNRIAWVAGEIDAWCEARARAREAA